MGKKLLIVNTYANLWSTGRIAAEIGEIAVKHGWQCYFAYASESNLCSCEEIRINKSVISYIIHTYLFSRILNLKGFGSWIETKLFIRKIKKIAPDIIHLHNIHQNFLNLPLLFSFLKKAGIPVIWTLHDCWAVTGGCTHFVYNKCENWKTGCYRCPRCGNSDTGGELKGVFRTMPWVLRKKEAYITSVPNLTFVTVAEWLSGVVRSSVVGSVPVQVISNGVDCTRFYPHTDIQAIKQKYGCGNRFMIVGVSSHWSASKGLYDYYKLRELLPADQFVIVLVGITSEQKNNIPDGIIGIERTENLDELALIYSAADVVTSLSYQETFGLTIVEGFACGTPAVVYDNTALPELIDSDTGLVVETGNMERLAEAIRQVCKTGKSFYSQACREVAQTRYDKFCQYEKYVELYEQALVSKKV